MTETGNEFKYCFKFRLGFVFWSLDIICNLGFVICDFKFIRISKINVVDHTK